MTKVPTRFATVDIGPFTISMLSLFGDSNVKTPITLSLFGELEAKTAIAEDLGGDSGSRDVAIPGGEAKALGTGTRRVGLCAAGGLEAARG